MERTMLEFIAARVAGVASLLSILYWCATGTDWWSPLDTGTDAGAARAATILFIHAVAIAAALLVPRPLRTRRRADRQ
jgi:hypothetical protein